jgi:hypothetical protein
MRKSQQKPRISSPARKGVFGQGQKAPRAGLYARISTSNRFCDASYAALSGMMVFAGIDKNPILVCLYGAPKRLRLILKIRVSSSIG